MALFLVLLGCSSPPSDELEVPDNVAVSGETEARLALIEQDLLSLKTENDRRFENLQKDMEAMKGQLEELSSALKGAGGKDDLDSSAKDFARESIQRMLDLSKKIMDKLEKELDKSTEPEPAPQNDKTI